MKKHLKHFLAWLVVKTGFLAIIKFIRIYVLHYPRSIILCYHRIADEQRLLGPTCVTSNNFDHQIALLKRYYSLQPLNIVVNKIGVASQKDSLSITFDDGYRDNYQEALKVLEKYDIKGTFYISTDPVLLGNKCWLDVIGHELDEAFKNRIFDTCFELLEDTEIQDYTGGNISTRQLSKTILNRLFDKGQDYIDTIRKKLDEPDVKYTEREYMTIEEILSLDRSGHEIGAHSATHPKMSLLNEHQCKREIETSILALKNLGINVKSFAYPFGKTEDIGDGALNAVRNARLQYAVTTNDYAITKEYDIHLLPRVVVGNQSPNVLALRLERLSWSGILKELYSIVNPRINRGVRL